MTDTSPRQPLAGQIPPDDPARRLAAASPDRDESLEHIGVVGDTYTILLSGRDNAGRYTLIDMHVPPGAGPPPHRHDFEEMFSILDSEALALQESDLDRSRGAVLVRHGKGGKRREVAGAGSKSTRGSRSAASFRSAPCSV